MSDSYETVAVADVALDDAEPLAEAVVSRLSASGLILPTLDADAALGGSAYRPGPRIPEVYRRRKHEGEFWTLLTNGMQVCVGRWVNQFGFTLLDGFTCPNCKATFALDDDAIADAFARAVGSFLEGLDDLDVKCSACNSHNPAPTWHTNPRLGFTNLAFQFWNWPPLADDAWSVDIPGLIESVTRHSVAVTHGRV